MLLKMPIFSLKFVVFSLGLGWMLEKIFYPWTKEQPDRQEVEIEDQIKEKTFHKNAAGWESTNSEVRSKVFMPRVKKRSKLEKIK